LGSDGSDLQKMSKIPMLSIPSIGFRLPLKAENLK